jgi:heme exporter protein A
VGESAEPLVQARGLSRRYGRHWALREVDLRVESGEAVVLAGANGAGKSTLLTILASLQRPSAGSLELFGQRVDKGDKSKIRARMGYVGHHTLLDDALTAQENLRYYADLFDVANPDQVIRTQLTRAGLERRAEDRVDGFSRGMRQRLSLARALLHDPEVLFLDEPFTGLDAPGCRDLAQRLAEEKQRGRALVLATHQMEQVLTWADRMVVLHHGHLVEETPTSARDAAAWALHLAEIAEGRS